MYIYIYIFDFSCIFACFAAKHRKLRKQPQQLLVVCSGFRWHAGQPRNHARSHNTKSQCWKHFPYWGRCKFYVHFVLDGCTILYPLVHCLWISPSISPSKLNSFMVQPVPAVVFWHSASGEFFGTCGESGWPLHFLSPSSHRWETAIPTKTSEPPIQMRASSWGRNGSRIQDPTIRQKMAVSIPAAPKISEFPNKERGCAAFLLILGGAWHSWKKSWDGKNHVK